MITYKETFNSNMEVISAKVLLDGKIIGEIKRTSTAFMDSDSSGVYHNYRYHPKDSRTSGEAFHTLNACKRSLEQE